MGACAGGGRTVVRSSLTTFSSESYQSSLPLVSCRAERLGVSQMRRSREGSGQVGRTDSALLHVIQELLELELVEPEARLPALERLEEVLCCGTPSRAQRRQAVECQHGRFLVLTRTDEDEARARRTFIRRGRRARWAVGRSARPASARARESGGARARVGGRKDGPAARGWVGPLLSGRAQGPATKSTDGGEWTGRELASAGCWMASFAGLANGCGL
jgi:hypothetical protein